LAELIGDHKMIAGKDSNGIVIVGGRIYGASVVNDLASFGAAKRG
jgi:hypothetical protein